MQDVLTTDQIRKRWIAFFTAKGHKPVASDSLVPADDPSVLFTGAGMNQFKDHFMGRAKLDHPQQRAVTVQKCVRAGDIENVGRTANHHTFFEMLGNFSFGDYFKDEAVQWAVEFLTSTSVGLGLDPTRLSVTVFGGDEALGIPKDQEAIAAWRKHAPWLKDERVPGGWRIYEYPEDENFWPASAPSKGPNGPCGPCSEIYYDTHAAWQTDAASAPPPVPVGDDEKRYCEIWNLVFTQYNRLDVGKLEPLPQKNIDTGSGLERVARVIQGKPTNFDIDLLIPIVQKVAQISGKTYGADFESDRRMRRITDHVRMAVFSIADGVNPGKDGREYVIRRLLRRAILDGRELGIDEPFAAQVAESVIGQMRVGYPELPDRKTLVLNFIAGEEKAFVNTLTQGRRHFDETVKRMKAEQKSEIPGEEAWKLWDTYGYPVELTIESAEVTGMTVDTAGFDAIREQQGSGQGKGDIFASGPLAELKEKYAGQATVFVGYEALHLDGATVLELIPQHTLNEKASADEATVLLDRSPFYGESGGQVGDTGWLTAGAARHRVLDTQKQDGLILHRVKLAGALKAGDKVVADVDAAHREPTIKNHSATHLLHKALREVLGTHVEQRGSLVAPERLRFDFTHFDAVSYEQLKDIEARVNGWIQDDFSVECQEMSLDEAKAAGAMALFGEKYGDRVRMVAMGPSKELCGGVHVARTGRIGYCRVINESSISAGVRRIEALTGTAAVDDARASEALLGQIAGELKAKKSEVLGRLHALEAERDALNAELKNFKKQAAADAAGGMLEQAKDVAGTKLLAAHVGAAGGKDLLATLDGIRKKLPEGAVVLSGAQDGKVALLVSLSKDLVKRGGHAGNLLKELAPLVGGRGGGRPDMAQGGGKDEAKIPEVLAKAEALLPGMLG